MVSNLQGRAGESPPQKRLTEELRLVPEFTQIFSRPLTTRPKSSKRGHFLQGQEWPTPLSSSNIRSYPWTPLSQHEAFYLCLLGFSFHPDL